MVIINLRTKFGWISLEYEINNKKEHSSKRRTFSQVHDNNSEGHLASVFKHSSFKLDPILLILLEDQENWVILWRVSPMVSELGALLETGSKEGSTLWTKKIGFSRIYNISFVSWQPSIYTWYLVESSNMKLSFKLRVKIKTFIHHNSATSSHQHLARVLS